MAFEVFQELLLYLQEAMGAYSGEKAYISFSQLVSYQVSRASNMTGKDGSKVELITGKNITYDIDTWEREPSKYTLIVVANFYMQRTINKKIELSYQKSFLITADSNSEYLVFHVNTLSKDSVRHKRF